MMIVRFPQNVLESINRYPVNRSAKAHLVELKQGVEPHSIHCIQLLMYLMETGKIKIPENWREMVEALPGGDPGRLVELLNLRTVLPKDNPLDLAESLLEEVKAMMQEHHLL